MAKAIDTTSWVMRWSIVLLEALVTFLSPVSAMEVTGRVVDARGKGITQAVVFVEELPASVTIESQVRTAVVDQVHKRFVPSLLPIPVGTEVRFPNHDQIHHHVYSFSRTKSFDIPLYKGEIIPSVQFDKPGVVKIGCNIHDWMAGTILVLPSPYYAVTDKAGRFVLPDLPPATYSLVCWHGRSRKPVTDTAQRVHMDTNTQEVTFTLDLKPARARPPTYGQRSYR